MNNLGKQSTSKRSSQSPDHVERVGIFGGTFDPIHMGHLILAEAALEELDLNRIIFIPAGVSPFKTSSPPSAPPELRLEMVRRAIDSQKRFSVDDREIKRSAPSYAIDTVHSLMNEHPGVRFFYLIGSDNLADLGKWRSITELKELVDFAILDRGGPNNFQKGSMQVVHRRIDLSSSEIRTRCANRLSIRFMVPEAVYTAIMTNQPYRSSLIDAET